MSLEVLVDHCHPLGACYLARTPQGFLAGRSPQQAQRFDSAQAVVDWFRPLAERGAHWAWNLCYFAQDWA